MADDADKNLAAWAAGKHSIFTLEQARAFGLTHRQIDTRVRDSWIHIHEGVFAMPGVALSHKARLLAACLAAESQPAGVSHRSGGALYELPGGRFDIVEISCRRWKRTRKSGLIVHESTRLSDDDLTTIEGIPVMIPERVIMELAGLRPYPDYVERVIQAARRKRLVTCESTLATFNRLKRRGLPGVRVMREALELWNPDTRATQSEMETMLLQLLRRQGLPDPVVQFDVLDEYGNIVATTDLALPQWEIVLEYDSIQEHSDEFQIARGERRRNEIEAAGYHLLVVRYHDLKSGGRRLTEQIERIARRAAS